MGLAAPGCVEHRLSMPLCQVGQCQLGHIYWHQSSHIQTMSFLSSARNLKVYERFDTGRGRCTWPYHLSRRQQRTNVMSSMSSFCSSEAEGVSSRSLMPKIQWIMARSLRKSCCSSGTFGPHVSLSWSIAARRQATYTFPCILGERCLEVRTG